MNTHLLTPTITHEIAARAVDVAMNTGADAGVCVHIAAATLAALGADQVQA